MGTSTLEKAAIAIFEFEELTLPARTRVAWSDATLLVKGHYLQRALISARTFADKTGNFVAAEADMADPNENFITNSPV